jgi:hypothetical protein
MAAGCPKHRPKTTITNNFSKAKMPRAETNFKTFILDGFAN